MRFEIYLTRLPKLKADEVDAKLGRLPGLSAGVLKKALADNKLPTIAVGWGDNEREIDRVRRKLAEFSGTCRVEDHAGILTKAWAAIEVGANDFLNGLSARFTRKRQRKKTKESARIQGAFATVFAAVLAFLFKAAAAVGVYGAYAMTRAHPVPPEQLVPHLVAVAVGVLSAHVVVVSIAAVVSHQIGLTVAVPIVVTSLSVVGFAAVSLEPAPEPVVEQVEHESFKPVAEVELPPRPSRPYQGLMEELRLRKLKASERVLQEVEVTPVQGEVAGVMGEETEPTKQAQEQAQSAHGKALEVAQAASTEVAVGPDGGAAPGEQLQDGGPGVAVAKTDEQADVSAADVADPQPATEQDKPTGKSERRATRTAPAALAPSPWPDPLVLLAGFAVAWVLTVVSFVTVNRRKHAALLSKLAEYEKGSGEPNQEPMQSRAKPAKPKAPKGERDAAAAPRDAEHPPQVQEAYAAYQAEIARLRHELIDMEVKLEVSARSLARAKRGQAPDGVRRDEGGEASTRDDAMPSEQPIERDPIPPRHGEPKKDDAAVADTKLAPPARRANVGPVAKNGTLSPERRSSYVVHDVEPERISVPKRDKR